MTISDIVDLLEANVLSPNPNLNHRVETVCGSDMMSDVLAFIKKDAILLTGLNNLQVIRTAELLDIVCIIFVRGKTPAQEMINLAGDGICLLQTNLTMFEACGKLYEAGLRGGPRDE